LIGVANGGTGLSAAPTNGQLLIGNGSGYTFGTLGNSNGLVVSNSAGAITMSTNAQTTNANNTLIMRDGSGGFSAGNITAQGFTLQGLGTVGISTPATANYSMILPSTIGTNGQVLSTNGIGSLSWITSISSQWTTSASNIGFGDGSAISAKVGIGTTGPISILHITQADGPELTITSPTNTGNWHQGAIVFRNPPTGGAYMGTYFNDPDAAGATGDEYFFGRMGGNMGLMYKTATGSHTRNTVFNGTRFLTAYPSGVVAVGTLGTVTGSQFEVSGGAITAAQIGSSAGQGGQMRIRELLANGTNSVAFRAPDSILQNVIMTLPGTIGTAGQVLSTDGVGALSWITQAGGGALTNFAEAVNTAAPNATVPVVSLTAVNAAATVDIAISPKNGGALTASVADGTTAGGNKRGPYAVDWQSTRQFNTEVASGAYSVINGGQWNTSLGAHSAVFGGRNNVASGNFSVVGGNQNTASGLASVIAGGQLNTASAAEAIVVGGWSNQALGDFASIAGGQNNYANTSAYYSFIAGGANNYTYGQYSFAANRNTTSYGYAQSTFGQYNVSTPGDFYSWILTDPLFVIGNGTSAGATSNAITVLKNGNVGIGATAPTYQLQLSTDSAAKPGTSTWTIASDERLKDIRAPFTRGLEALNGLQTIYFNYKHNNALDLPSEKEFVGIRAQDAQKVIPESVSVDDKGYLHVTNDSIIWTAVNAIKELYQKFMGHELRLIQHEREIASLKSENLQLKKENAEFKLRMEKIEQALKSK
jgi:hypothetical protein